MRKVCTALPDTTEKTSHGEPTFFTKNRVYVLFANHHHQDGRLAVYVPAPPGEQEALIHLDAKKYFRPPYVGGKGWVGIELEEVDDGELSAAIVQAHRVISAWKRAPRC